ncbi:MAG: FecR domain-containing protein, partial [Pseudomonadota bacterium]
MKRPEQTAMTPSDRPSERVRVAAYEWHLKMQEGRMSAEELHRLEQWLASEPSHRAAYERAGDLWYELGGLDPDCIPETARRPLLRERLLDWAQAGLQRWIMRATFAAMATSAALFVAVQLNGTGWISDSTATGIAETRVLTLSDGSVVALSPRTEVSVDYDGPVRLVQLAEGEAFFDVKRDPERPFRVEAGSSELTVVGTAFNVRHIE